MPSHESPTFTSTVSGTDIEYHYTRLVAAIAAGAVFTVEWNDTLSPFGWSSTGVWWKAANHAQTLVLGRTGDDDAGWRRGRGGRLLDDDGGRGLGLGGVEGAALVIEAVADRTAGGGAGDTADERATGTVVATTVVADDRAG